MNSRRNLLILSSALALGLAALFVTVRHASQDMAKQRVKDIVKRAEGKAKDKLVESLANASAQGAQLSGTDDEGRPLWSVGADKSQLRTDSDGTQHATLFGARATMYKEGEPQSRLRGAKLELTRTSDEKVNLVLSGGVTAQSEAPAQKGFGAVMVSTPRVAVDVTARHLVADGGVTMTQGQGSAALKITAPRLETDMGLATARVSGGVTATSPQGTLRAPEATWNWQSGRVSASGGVTASHQDTTLTGARLDADTQGKSGTLSGDVTAKAPGGTARASSASYNWAAGSVTASGGVTLTKDDGVLRAARVECDDKLQHATASGGVTLTKGEVTIRAARADAFENFARATASGAVTLTKGALSLRAGHVEVYDRGQRAVATGGVTLHQNDLTVASARADATNLGDKNALRVVAEGGVTARNASGTVRASRVTWGGGQVAASGGVRAQRADLNLSADNFASDDAGRRATLTGHVVVTHPSGASLHAPHARYDKGANKVWAEGGIEFHDAGGGVLHGKTLVADLNLKRAQISGLEGTVSVKTLPGKDLF